MGEGEEGEDHRRVKAILTASQKTCLITPAFLCVNRFFRA